MGRLIAPHEYPLAQITSGKVREASLQAHYLRPDGSLIWTDLHGAAILDSEGTLKGAVLAMSDIDRRKRAEAAAARDDRRAAPAHHRGRGGARGGGIGQSGEKAPSSPT